MKKSFFDRQKVIAVVDKKKLAFLRTVGGYVRKTARNSMKRKGKARATPKNFNGAAYRKWVEEARNQPASQPGSPPFTHSDNDTTSLKFILFAFNTTNKSVMVGPVGFNRGAVPALHEFGGTLQVAEKEVRFPNGGRIWTRMGARGARSGQQTRSRSAKYPARPFMKPAIEKTKSQSRFKQLWFSSGTGSAG